MDLWNEIVRHVTPSDAVTLPPRDVLILAATMAALVAIGPLWRVARLLVTLVHELGHAVTGILVGRKFTGFVLRMDASGHAVTHGRSRGPGRVLTTWAGYPAPAIVGALLVLASLRGWAPPVLAVVMLILLTVALRIRSFLTGVVLLAALAGTGTLWWFADDRWQSLTLLLIGGVLLLGAWRHLGAVSRDATRGSDPMVLAGLTVLPRLFWLLTFALVCGGATWLAVCAVLHALA